MNSIERAKVAALEECRLAFAVFDRTFIRNMGWLRANASGKTLSPRQKWGLDCLIHKYRRQLGGRALPFEIPAEPPKLADYGIEEPKAMQKNIFGGEDKPRRTPIQPPEWNPQRELF
jgi:hypothetical protein